MPFKITITFEQDGGRWHATLPNTSDRIHGNGATIAEAAQSLYDAGVKAVGEGTATPCPTCGAIAIHGNPPEWPYGLFALYKEQAEKSQE